MTDPATTSDHYAELTKDLQAWIKMLLGKQDFEGAFGLRLELEWLSARAGMKA